MNRGFYPRLAWTGMKQNRRLYLPYLLTCTGVTAMFYILMGLSVSTLLPQMSGGRSTALIMSLGSVVIAFFALIFLFYTHSFLIRRRSREFGLYNVLGMGKGNIARILLWETLLTYAGTTVVGLALGVALSKLAELPDQLYVHGEHQVAAGDAGAVRRRPRSDLPACPVAAAPRQRRGAAAQRVRG